MWPFCRAISILAPIALAAFGGCSGQEPDDLSSADTSKRPRGTGGAGTRVRTDAATVGAAAATDSESPGGAAGETAKCSSGFGIPSVAGSLVNYSLPELSGLVSSRQFPGVLYAHADSGAPPELAAFDESGQFLGAILLDGATATDWEDIAIGSTGEGSDKIYVGDIGDNDARDATGFERASIQIYRFTEPAPTNLSESLPFIVDGWDIADLMYPDTPYDAEALFVDPVTLAPLIVTKANDGHSLVFSVPLDAFGSGTVTPLELVGAVTVGSPFDASAQVTAADISPNGDRILLRTYTAALLYPRLTTWAETFAAAPTLLPSPNEPQGEAITFSADGSAWFSAGEQSSLIYRAEFSCQESIP